MGQACKSQQSGLSGSYFAFRMQRVEKCRNKFSNYGQEKYQFCERNKLLMEGFFCSSSNHIIQSLFRANSA